MKEHVTSQITFLYFEDLPKARSFFEEVLQLEKVYDPDWAVVYRTTGKAFLGAVDAARGSIEVSNSRGVLISLTVENVGEWFDRLQDQGLEQLTSVKAIEDIGLKSFFFKGPEGYDFEIQEFVDPSLRILF